MYCSHIGWISVRPAQYVVIKLDLCGKMYHTDTLLRVCYLSPLTIGGLHFSLVIPVVARRPPLTIQRKKLCEIEIAHTILGA